MQSPSPAIVARRRQLSREAARYGMRVIRADRLATYTADPEPRRNVLPLRRPTTWTGPRTAA